MLLSSAVSIPTTRSGRQCSTSGCGCCMRCRAALFGCERAHPAMNARFRHQARNRGINPKRLIFAGRMDEFCARIWDARPQADLFLDTFPYNAHATASDALWAGLAGRNLAGRKLCLACVVQLAGQPGAGRTDRRDPGGLRGDRPVPWRGIASTAGRLSPASGGGAQDRSLFDMDRFARGIEAAYLRNAGAGVERQALWNHSGCRRKPSQYLRGGLPKSH